MLHLIVGAAAAASCFSAPAPTPTAPLLGFPCEQIPPGADQECRDCMTDACDEYQIALDACGNNTACKLAAKAAYEAQLADCTSCNPHASREAAALIAVLPGCERAWVLRRLSEMRSSRPGPAGLSR